MEFLTIFFKTLGLFIVFILTIISLIAFLTFEIEPFIILMDNINYTIRLIVVASFLYVALYKTL